MATRVINVIETFHGQLCAVAKWDVPGHSFVIDLAVTPLIESKLLYQQKSLNLNASFLSEEYRNSVQHDKIMKKISFGFEDASKRLQHSS